MLLRSTTASIRRDASGFVCPASTVPTSAPAPDPGKFRLPSPSWAVLAYASALSVRIEVCCPTPVFQVRPFAFLRRLLWPRLTSGSPSQHLAMSVALKQTARSPRVLHTHLPAYACRIYVAVFRARIGLHRNLPAHPTAPPHPLPVRQASALPSASVRFHLAMDTVAVWLTLPLAGCVEDFRLQVSAPCRAHKMRARHGAVPFCFGPEREGSANALVSGEYRFLSAELSLECKRF